MYVTAFSVSSICQKSYKEEVDFIRTCPMHYHLIEMLKNLGKLKMTVTVVVDFHFL